MQLIPIVNQIAAPCQPHCPLLTDTQSTRPTVKPTHVQHLKQARLVEWLSPKVTNLVECRPQKLAGGKGDFWPLSNSPTGISDEACCGLDVDLTEQKQTFCIEGGSQWHSICSVINCTALFNTAQQFESIIWHKLSQQSIIHCFMRPSLHF